MHKPVNIGIAGAGRIGQIHAYNLATRIKGPQVVAIADIDKSRADKLAREYGAGSYTDFNLMLEKADIDAIIICTSTDAHKQIIIDAAHREKHIFCEKPIALSLEETDEALSAVREEGVLMQIGFMRRFDPALSSAKKEIDKGSIGEPLVFKAISKDPEGPPVEYVRISGGLFVDSSIHEIDLARWLMGSEVKEVYAKGKTLIYPEYEKYQDVDVALTTLNFENSGIGNIENSRRSGYGYDTRVEISGSEGTLQIGYLQHKRYLMLKKSKVTHDVVPSWQERFEDAFVNEMQHFVNCVANNITPMVTGDDARKALQIALAATKSCRKGMPVGVK